MSTNRAEIEIVANPSRLPSGLAAAKRMVEGFAGQTRNAMSMLSRAPMGAANMLGRVAEFRGANRGIDILIEQGKAVFDFNDALVRFGIAARKTPSQMAEIGAAARKIGADVGIGADKVLAAGRAFIDLAGAENFSIAKMDLLARAAQATGSDTQDLAGMMYQLTRSMKVTDAEMENTMGGLINQAKDGAIEAKQMASEFAAILPLFARFGVLGREGTIQAGAMFQVMRDGANSAGEAGTMVQRVYAGIQSFAPRFESQGVQVFQKVRDKLGRKVLLPFNVIFKNIQNSDAMKDPAVLKKMFGRTEGWRGMLLGDEASRALGNTDGAINKTISRLEQLEAAGRMNGVVQQDLATYTESTAGRMGIAFEKMKNAIAEAFTPERIEKFTQTIESLVDKVGPLVEMVGKLGDALGAVMSVGQGVRGIFSSNANNNPYRADTAMSIKDAEKKGINWNDVQNEHVANRRSYDAAVDAIMSTLDKNEKPTEKSAIAAAKFVMSDITAPGGKGAKDAGLNFFASAGINHGRYDEIYAKAREEMKQEELAKGGSSRIGDDVMLETIRKGIADGVKEAARTSSSKPPVMEVDGRAIGKVSDNSRDRRRKP